MKITSVRFLNLNSLQGEHHIRFDEAPLSESGLFAITGPTGAGKTTILDAITVALYGEVPRHNSGKPIREIMTRHTGECKSEVEFIAHNKQYRSTWSLRRSRGKATGEFQSVHMELCLVEDGIPFDLKPSEVPKRVSDIIGLDFQQFLRSVMLSQGDFTRFLKASESERSELLEKLTDTRIYSQISMAAYEKAKAEKQKLQDIEQRLQLDQLLPEEARASLTQEVATLKASARLAQQHVQNHVQQQAWLENLQKLQSKESQYTAQLSDARAQQEAWLPQQQKLKQHEQVQPFQSDLARYEEIQRQGQSLAFSVEQLQQQIPAQEQKVTAQIAYTETARTAHAQAQQLLAEAEPRLDLVLQKDTQIAGQQEQFLKDQQATSHLQTQLQQLSTALEKQEGEEKHLLEEGRQLKAWLKENELDKELTQSLHEGKSEWKNLEEVQKNKAKYQKEKSDFGLELAKEANNALDLQSRLTATEQQVTDQKSVLSSLQEQAKTILAGQEPDALEQLCHSLPGVCHQLERQLDLSKTYVQLENSRAQLQTQLAQVSQELHQLRTQHTQTQQQQEQAKDKLKDLQQIVDLQRQIQQYEDARAQLQPEQPCPLCGSLHHPFVEEHQPQTLSEAEQNVQHQQAHVKTLEAQEREQATAVHKLELAEQNTQKQISETTEQALRLQQQFAHLNTALDLAHDIALSQTIDQTWTTRKQELATATASLQQLRTLRSQTEQAKQQEQILFNDQQRFRHELEKTAQKRGLLQNQLDRLSDDLQDLLEQETVVTQTLKSFFKTYGLTFTGENGPALLATLEARRNTYQQKDGAMPELREKYSQAQAEAKATKAALEEKRGELEKRQDQLSTAEIHLKELRAHRYELLPEGQQPQQEKQRLQQNLQQAAQALQASESALQQAQEQLNLLAHQRSAKQKDQSVNQEALAQLEKQLLSKIQPLGFTALAEIQALLLPDSEANSLRQQQEQLRKALTELEHGLHHVKQEFASEKERHLTELTLEEVQPLILALEEEKNQHLSQIARLEMQLQQDTDLRAKHQFLAKQLEVQKGEADRWDKLARLIGSADGKKFSKYAQSLTLARLVDLGNRHLLKLNDRYRILKSQDNELDLQIVDTYQGDAVRSVNSLSGGESFLVSLALALGLSDLASHKAQIHSLFIDEGFGTLDAETLDIAMDALESLQASGKMIGIISHVEALKERISTQIVVEKQAGGRSQIRVVSSNVLI